MVLTGSFAFMFEILGARFPEKNDGESEVFRVFEIYHNAFEMATGS